MSDYRFCFLELDGDEATLSGNQQAKTGEAVQGTSETAGTSNAISPPSAQPCGDKESNTTTNTVKNSNNELVIPILDLNRPDVINKLEKIGINLFIPASCLTSCSDHSKFAIPILSAANLQRAGNSGFPLCGAIKLGAPQEILPSNKSGSI